MTKTTSDGLERTPVSRRIDGYRPNAADVRAMEDAVIKRERKKARNQLREYGTMWPNEVRQYGV